MSGYLVVDSSFIMSTILPDEGGHHKYLAQYNIYVPAIFYPECSNVLRSAMKQKRISQDDFAEYLSVLKSLPFKVDHFSSSSDAMHSIMKLACDFDLSSYDASYLELAIRLNAKLASYDKKLIDASRQKDVVLVAS